MLLPHLPSPHTLCGFVNGERGLQPEAVIPHAALLDQASAHVQYSPLLPPVGVWAVSQSPCAGYPLRPATRRSLGRPLPHQQADRPRAHPPPTKVSTNTTCVGWSYPVLDPVSEAYPRVKGRLLACYSPVRRSCTPTSWGLTARLACVKHAASVRPEPGSNSPSKLDTRRKQTPGSRQNHHLPKNKPKAKKIRA